MKTSELRINNKVYSKLHNLEAEIWSVESHNKVRLNLNPLALYDVSEIEPIIATKENLLELGFELLPNFNIMGSLIYKLSRGREISIGCVNTPNCIMYLGELNEGSKSYSDLVVLHNWDYDKDLYLHKVQNILIDLKDGE